MGKRKLNTALALLIVLVGGSILRWPVHAKALSGLSFTPAYVRIDIPAGQTIQDAAIAVKNNSSSIVRLHAEPVDVDTTSSSLTPLSTSKTRAAKSIQVRNPDVTLLPNQSINILFRIDGTQLSAGSQFASVVIKQVADSTKQGLPINQAASIGVFIVKEQGAIRTLQLQKKLPGGVITKQPTVVPLSFFADGNVSLVPRAAVTVSEGDDVIAKAIINENSESILPQSSKSFSPTLHYERALSPGRHILTVSYHYDGQDDPLIVQSTIWYIPLWYLFIVASGALSLGFLWWRHRKQPVPPQPVTPELPVQKKSSKKAVTKRQ